MLTIQLLLKDGEGMMNFSTSTRHSTSQNNRLNSSSSPNATDSSSNINNMRLTNDLNKFSAFSRSGSSSAS